MTRRSRLPAGGVAALAAAALACSVAVPAAVAETQKQELNLALLLWPGFPLAPRPRRTVRRASEPTVPPQTLRIVRRRSEYSGRIVLEVFLAGLLAVGGVLVVGRRFMPAAESAGDGPPSPEPVEAMLEVLEPKPTPRASPMAAAVPQCEIRLWRGADACQLQVVLVDAEAEPILRSSYFRLRDDESPESRAQVALGGLLASLAREGWELVSTGPSWYERRLQRPAVGASAAD